MISNAAIAPTIPMVWDGEIFKPVSQRWGLVADKYFVVGAVYNLDVREERSQRSHAHYFATINEAWNNLPERIARRFGTPDHLRRYALIRAGFYDERSFACGSSEVARTIAVEMKRMDTYAFVVVRDTVVIVYNAKSQSMRAMGAKEFQRSKEGVLAILADMLRVTQKQLTDAGEQA